MEEFADCVKGVNAWLFKIDTLSYDVILYSTKT